MFNVLCAKSSDLSLQSLLLLLFRKVQTESATGSSTSSRVRSMLSIEVEMIDFDTQACVLRLKGRNVEENPYVKVNIDLFGSTSAFYHCQCYFYFSADGGLPHSRYWGKPQIYPDEKLLACCCSGENWYGLWPGSECRCCSSHNAGGHSQCVLAHWSHDSCSSKNWCCNSSQKEIKSFPTRKGIKLSTHLHLSAWLTHFGLGYESFLRKCTPSNAAPHQLWSRSLHSDRFAWIRQGPVLWIYDAVGPQDW